MTEITAEVVIGQLVSVLREAFEGPQEQWSYFADSGADAGLLGTLAKLSAAEASHPVGGTSVAAHVYHVRFALAASSAWIRGERKSNDWAASWRVNVVDNGGWTQLQEQLRTGYSELLQAIQAGAMTSLPAFGGAVGAIAHVAYHLGAIKQKVACAYPVSK
jgi:hypothetical protein